MKTISTRWALLCACLLAGCGGASDDQATTPSAKAQEPAPIPETSAGAAAQGTGSDVEMQRADEPTAAEQLPTTPTSPATPPTAATAGTPGSAYPSAGGTPGSAAPSTGSSTGMTKSEPAAPLAAPSSTPAPGTGASTQAEADVKLLKGSTSIGTLHFEQVGNQVLITGQFTGLPPGMHGFHIHENGDCGGKAAKNAGGHFNPTGAKHGPPESGIRHAGDFGNLTVDESGNASFEMKTDSLTVSPGADSVVGRAIVIHAKKDNGKSQPTGAAGNPIACGVIEARGALDTTSGKQE
jgi:superoxide dismutase, Cu-Zn family